MTLRACKRCGAPFTPRNPRHLHCAAHEPHGASSRSPSTQAQDGEYRRLRRALLADEPACVYCGRPATTADHVIPVARGGGHRGNLVPACAPCNASKGARDAPVRLS